MIIPALALGLSAAGMAASYFGSSRSRDERRSLGQFRDLAAGRGPSYATQLAGQYGATAARNMQGVASGAGGTNPALGMRQAFQAGSQMNRQIAGDTAAIRSQEQLSAMRGYADLAGQAANQQRQRFAALGQGLGALGAGLPSLMPSAAPPSAAPAGWRGPLDWRTGR